MSHWQQVTLTSNHIYTSKKLQNTPDSFGNVFITNFGAWLSFQEIETTFIKAKSHWQHVTLTCNHIYTSEKLQNTPDLFGKDYITNFCAQLSFKEIETTFIKAMSHWQQVTLTSC